MPRKTPIRAKAERLAELRSIMDAHNIEPAKVAEILNRKPSTLRVWLSGAQGVPEDALRLLKMSAASGTEHATA